MRRLRSTVPLALAIVALLLPSAAAAQQTHLLVVAGLGGGQEYREQFLNWALTLRSAAVDTYGLPEANVVVLAEDPSMDPAVSARSTRDNIDAALQGIATRAGAQDRVLIVLLGHGTYRGEEALFNLPGPDLSAKELGVMLGGLTVADVAVVNTTSASGPWVQVLGGPGRTIIAATKTGRERNETRFGQFFAAAFEDDAADLDKNGSVSLLEAFTYARGETARQYEEDNVLLTEHAVLDGDGDGEGTEEPTVDSPEGALAAAFVLGRPGARGVVADGAPATEGRPVPADSALARLYEERDSLEQQVAELRRHRDDIDPEEYDRRLEAILVDLALKNREIRAREGGGP